MVTDSPIKTPYERFSAIALRVLRAKPDVSAAAQLGQSVSYVLDSGHREDELHSLISDLESARVEATRGDIAEEWRLPLATVLGVVRQHLQDERIRRETADPSSKRLRDRILVTIRSGVTTPSLIAKAIDSPPTVVSRVLSQLTQDGVIGFTKGSSSDKRIREYRLIPVRSAGSLVDTEVVADGNHRSNGSRAGDLTSLSDPQTIIGFARQQIQVNPTICRALQPGLQRVGMDPSLAPAIRVQALATAMVICRSLPSSDPEECLALAELIRDVAQLDDSPLVRARASYEEIRARLMDRSADGGQCAAQLDDVISSLTDDRSPAADVMRGWIAHAKSLIFSRTDAEAAVKHADESAARFRAVGKGIPESLPKYGECGALTVRAREQLRLLRSRPAYEDATTALEIANRNGFVRIMAEANLWAGEAALDCEPAAAPRYLETAAQLFTGLQLETWRLFAESSLAVYDLGPNRLGRSHPERESRQSKTPKSAADVIKILDRTAAELENQGNADMFWSTSWASACVTRRTAVVARWDGDRERAKQRFERCIGIYEQLGDPAGLAMAVIGSYAVDLHIEEMGPIGSVGRMADLEGAVRNWATDNSMVDFDDADNVLKRLGNEPWLELAAPL